MSLKKDSAVDNALRRRGKVDREELLGKVRGETREICK